MTVPHDPETQLAQIQADLMILQFVVVNLVNRLAPNDRANLVDALNGMARGMDDFNARLPTPGAAEETTHQCNVAARKLMEMMTLYRTDKA